jgi:hypothetical protein
MTTIPATSSEVNNDQSEYIEATPEQQDAHIRMLRAIMHLQAFSELHPLTQKGITKLDGQILRDSNLVLKRLNEKYKKFIWEMYGIRDGEAFEYMVSIYVHMGTAMSALNYDEFPKVIEFIANLIRSRENEQEQPAT